MIQKNNCTLGHQHMCVFDTLHITGWHSSTTLGPGQISRGLLRKCYVLGSMDLGTDYSYAGVLLALLTRSFTQGAWRMLGRYTVVASISFLRACFGCILNEGARESSSRQAITPARYDEGTLATNHNAAKGKGGYRNTRRLLRQDSRNSNTTPMTHKRKDVG